MRLAILAALGLTLGACDSAPANPTYRADVAPILAANCARCHGRILRGGAPEGIRLDLYSSASGFSAAADLSSRVSARTGEKTMPPRTPLTDLQIETLQNWDDDGAPLGDPNPDNRLPEIETDGFADDEVEATLAYIISDEDFEIVTGTLTATPAGGGTAILITDDLHSGAGSVDWFVAGVPTGDYDISASLDDGQEPRDVDLGSFTVARADSNTAPTLTVQTPIRGGTIGGVDQSFEFTIEDPDVGDTADVDFTLVRGDQILAVTTVMDAPIGANSVVVDISALPEGPNFTLVAQAGLSSTSVELITVRH